MADGYFVELGFVTDETQLRQQLYDALGQAYPGWQPYEGDVEVWVARWVALVAANLSTIAGLVAREVFSTFGQQLVNIPPLTATSATASTTWTMIDSAGYTIPAGTNVVIPKSASEWVAFQTVDEVAVAPGDTVTATGEVLLRAILPGEDANGLVDTPQLVDALGYVSGIVLESVTSGGSNDEDADTFLSRLALELTTFADRPILPADVEILARKVPGVHRALALDGYNPDDETFDNERYVSVACVDENGLPCSAPIKTAVDNALQARREVSFIFRVIDPTVTQVDVAVTFVPYEGYDPASVANDVEAAITDYLDPAKWGIPPLPGSDPAGWRQQTTVRRTELEALVNSVIGVDYVPGGGLTLVAHGGSLGSADVTLNGVAPLASPGTITATPS